VRITEWFWVGLNLLEATQFIIIFINNSGETTANSIRKPIV
jgi:hypothetical protein